MTDWNVLIGIPALVLGGMLLWAFRSYVFAWRRYASVHLASAIFWFNVRGSGRSVWWDGFNGFGLGNSSNWIWNLIGAYAALQALWGLYMLLPEKERRHYNILTVAFYPHRYSLRSRPEGEEE